MRIGVVAALPIVASMIALASCESFSAQAADGDAGGASNASDGAGPTEAGDASDGNAPLTYPAAVLADAPVLYYRLGEHTSGGPAVDLAQSKHNAVLDGNVVTGVPGAIAGDPDTAFRFDGMTAAVVLGDGPTFGGSAPYSIEAWVRPNTTTGAHVITACQAEQAGGWAMFFDSSPAPVIERQIAVPGGSDRTQGGAVSTTAFAHVVGTFDGTTQSLYVDGMIVSAAASKKMIPGPAGVPFAIGANGVSATNARFDGDIDEVAIYDHVLSAERVHAHHQIGRGLAP